MFLSRFKKGNTLSYIIVVLAVMSLSVSLMSSITPGKNNVMQDNNEALKLLNQLTEQQAERVANDIQGDSQLFDLSTRNSEQWDTSNNPCIGTDNNFKNYYYPALLTPTALKDVCQYDESVVNADLMSDLSFSIFKSALVTLYRMDNQALYATRNITFHGQPMTVNFLLKDSTKAYGLKRLLKTSSDTLKFGEPGSDAIAVTIEGSIQGTNQVVYKTIVVNRPINDACSGQINTALKLDTDTPQAIVNLTTPPSFPLQVGAVYGNLVQLGSQQICDTSKDYTSQNTINCNSVDKTLASSNDAFLLNALRYNDAQSGGARQAQVRLYFVRSNSRPFEGILQLFVSRFTNSASSPSTIKAIQPIVALPAARNSINTNTVNQYFKTQIFLPKGGSGDGKIVVVYPTTDNKLVTTSVPWNFSTSTSTPSVFTAISPIPGITFDMSKDKFDFNPKTKMLAIATTADRTVRYYHYDSNGSASLIATIPLPVSPTTNLVTFGQMVESDNAALSSTLLTALDNSNNAILYQVNTTGAKNLSTAVIPNVSYTGTPATTYLYYGNGSFYWLIRDAAQLYTWRPETSRIKQITTIDGSPLWPTTDAYPPQIIAMDKNQLAIRTEANVWLYNTTGLYPIQSGLSDTSPIPAGNLGEGSLGTSLAYIAPYLYFTSPSANILYRYNATTAVNSTNYLNLEGDPLDVNVPKALSTYDTSYNISKYYMNIASDKGTGSLLALPEQNNVYVIASDSLALHFYAVPVINTCPNERYRSGQYTNSNYTVDKNTGVITPPNGFIPTNAYAPNSEYQGAALDSLSTSFIQPARSI